MRRLFNLPKRPFLLLAILCLISSLSTHSFASSPQTLRNLSTENPQTVSGLEERLRSGPSAGSRQRLLHSAKLKRGQDLHGRSEIQFDRLLKGIEKAIGQISPGDFFLPLGPGTAGTFLEGPLQRRLTNWANRLRRSRRAKAVEVLIGFLPSKPNRPRTEGELAHAVLATRLLGLMRAQEATPVLLQWWKNRRSHGIGRVHEGDVRSALALALAQTWDGKNQSVKRILNGIVNQRWTSKSKHLNDHVITQIHQELLRRSPTAGPSAQPKPGAGPSMKPGAGLEEGERVPSVRQYRRQADRLRVEKRYAEAEALLREGLSHYPGDRRLWNLRMEVLTYLKSPDLAEVAQRVIRLFPDDPSVRAQAARALLIAGRYEEAVRWIDETVERFPKSRLAKEFRRMIERGVASASVQDEGALRLLVKRYQEEKPPAGLEELTAEKARAVGEIVASKLQEPLGRVEENLAALKQAQANGTLSPEELKGRMSSIALAGIEISEILHRLNLSDFPGVSLSEREFSILQSTLRHEINNAVAVFSLWDFYFGDATITESDLEKIPDSLDQMGKSLLRVLRVLEELSLLEYVRFARFAGWIHVALSSSESTRPQWMTPETFSFSTGSGPADPQVRAHIVAEAQQLGANQLLLVPLAPRETISLQPYYFGDVKYESWISTYFDHANERSVVPGIHFENFQRLPLNVGDFKKLSFLVRSLESSLPTNLPEGYRSFTVDELLGPPELPPAFLAAKLLYPDLPWELFERLELKTVSEVADEATGLRYLVLAAA